MQFMIDWLCLDIFTGELHFATLELKIKSQICCFAVFAVHDFKKKQKTILCNFCISILYQCYCKNTTASFKPDKFTQQEQISWIRFLFLCKSCWMYAVYDLDIFILETQYLLYLFFYFFESPYTSLRWASLGRLISWAFLWTSVDDFQLWFVCLCVFCPGLRNELGSFSLMHSS